VSEEGCVAVWCNVLQHVLQCIVVYGTPVDLVKYVSKVYQCIAVCFSVLQCVAVCCSVLQQGVSVRCTEGRVSQLVLQCVAVCCSVLQRRLRQ